MYIVLPESNGSSVDRVMFPDNFKLLFDCIWIYRCKLFFYSFYSKAGYPLLNAAKNFTLLIKNTVQFPKFKETRYCLAL